MASSETIEHSGIIKEITGKLVKVHIIPESACGKCSAKNSCSVGNIDEKTIDLLSKPDDIYHVGEKVKVVMDQGSGMKAVGLGYLLPFAIVMIILITSVAAGLGEGFAAMLSLGALAPYYLVLYLSKEKLRKEFSFRLEKI